jgi:ABC-type multidrug transport system ATPase subunit
MMMISLKNAGKRFNHEWIFRHLTYTFEAGSSYAITGPNGSGKSTLLQSLSGSMQFSEGTGEWKSENGALMNDKVYQQIAICAPYLELIEEMTAKEFLDFHAQFKPFLPPLSTEDILSLIHLEHAAGKQIRYFSSGMKQRIKLAQAIFADVPVLLLDEPCTNLDIDGTRLYQDLIERFAGNKLVIVSSNDQQEYQFCKHTLSITDYK